MSNYSKKTVSVFVFIMGFIEKNHWAPTRQEICVGTGISNAKVLMHLKILEDKCFIFLGNSSRQIALRDKKQWQND